LRGGVEIPSSALLFGLIYAVVLFVVAAAKERYGARGLYAVAALSGLTDVDAITLSTAQLVNAGRLNAEDGWRLVVLAAISNPDLQSRRRRGPRAPAIVHQNFARVRRHHCGRHIDVALPLFCFLKRGQTCLLILLFGRYSISPN